MASISSFFGRFTVTDLLYLRFHRLLISLIAVGFLETPLTFISLSLSLPPHPHPHPPNHNHKPPSSRPHTTNHLTRLTYIKNPISQAHKSPTSKLRLLYSILAFFAHHAVDVSVVYFVYEGFLVAMW